MKNVTTKGKLKIVSIVAAVMASILCIGAIAGGLGILTLDKDKAKDTLLPNVNPDN